MKIQNDSNPHFPAHKSKMLIGGNTGICFLFDSPRPNAFRRFWYWLLLGWQWEDIGE